MAIRPSEFILMTLKTGSKTLGLSIDAIQKIIEPIAFTRVPVTAPVFEGFIYFRQQILPLIDLVRVLGQEKNRSAEDEKFLIVSSNSFSAALRIDGVGGTYTCHSESIQNEQGDKTLNLLVSETITIGNQQIPLLNLKKLQEQIVEGNQQCQQKKGYGLDH